MARPRAGIVAGLWLALASGWLQASSEPAREFRFRVLLDDNEIGFHSFRLAQQAEREVVEIDAEFKVTFFAIPVYRYEHENREVWRQGCLESIVSTTDDGGDDFRVKGSAKGAGFEVSTQDGEMLLESECVMTFAYWRRDFLNQPKLLNAQNGEYLSVDVESEGAEVLQLSGRPVAADRYRLRNAERDIDIRVWYAQDSDRWLSLESRVEGGRVIRYLPVDPQQAPVEQAEAGSSTRDGPNTRK